MTVIRYESQVLHCPKKKKKPSISITAIVNQFLHQCVTLILQNSSQLYDIPSLTFFIITADLLQDLGPDTASSQHIFIKTKPSSSHVHEHENR